MRYLLIIVVALVTLPQDALKRDHPAASRPTTSQSAAGRTPEQARVLTELLQQTERPAAIAPEPTRPVDGTSPPKGDSLAPEGTIWERAGRLAHNGERSEFRFISPDKPELTQALELLPNSWLEYMEKEAESGATDFIIRAEVTRYRGRNFLLLQNYRRQVSNNNLSP